MQHRLSELQRLILEELVSIRKSKTTTPEDLSMRVAKRYSPEKIWRSENLKDPEMRAFARSLHRKNEIVTNGFSATFSRSLRNLEKKGLIQLIRGKHELKFEGNEVTIYRIRTPQPRVTFIVHNESRYFGDKLADAHFVLDIIKEINRSV